MILRYQEYLGNSTSDGLGHPCLSRGLAEMNDRLAGEAIHEILTKIGLGGDIRVLEIGCGEGRLLMELRQQYSNVKLFGVNKSPWAAMTGADSLKAVAKHFNIFDEAELSRICLPTVVFADAAKLPFDSEYFDLIVSQACLHWVEDKVGAIQEIIRTLRPGGVARIHLDSIPKGSSDDCALPTPRLIIDREGQKVSIENILNEQSAGIINASLKIIDNDDGSQRVLLSIEKLNRGEIALGLRKVEEYSPAFYNRHGQPQYGIRTVYVTHTK